LVGGVLCLDSTRVDIGKDQDRIGIDHSLPLPLVSIVCVSESGESVNAALHRETVLPAIEAGKDVFVEWPAGNGLKESIELAEASRRKGIRTMVGLQGRNTPVVKKVRFTTRNSRSWLIFTFI
jgi:hypothetical protein